MRGWITITAVVTMVLFGCRGVASKPSESITGGGIVLTGISGMTPLDGGKYLVVHDGKEASQARAGIISVRGGVEYRAVTITGEAPEKVIADLESIGAVPGRENEFLALESGSRQGSHAFPRRLVLLRLEGERLRVLGMTDVAAQTTELMDCESIIVRKTAAGLSVMIADRTNAGTPGSPRITAAMGSLRVEDDGARLTWMMEKTVQIGLPALPSKRWRACSDLWIGSDGRLWGASVVDPGNAGPFQSRIFVADAQDDGWKDAKYVAEVAGLKIEALAGDAGAKAPGCFGTDDEDFGGVWRPLSPVGTER